MNGTARPRLGPLPKERWNEDVRAALRTGFPAAARFLESNADAPPPPNVLATLLRHPKLAGPFLIYNRVLLEKPALEPRLRELMILRVAWRGQSIYEWVQHTFIAMGLGITADEITAITTGAGEWSPLEADLLAATDQLIDHWRIEDHTWARLAEHLDDQQLVEVVFVIGTYTCLAMAFNSFGLELEPGVLPLKGVPIPQYEGPL